MTGALTSLLEAVFDYAGVFPPALLDMRSALEAYIRHIDGDEQWLVSRFVCASAMLPELAKALDQRQSSPEIPVAVIGKAAVDYDGWGYALEEDARAMTSFMNTVQSAASLEAYEIRVPSHTHLDSCLKDLNAFNEVDVFVELPWAEEMDDSLAMIAQTEWVFAKARTGGLDASDFPSAESLAGFLHAALSLDVPIKLTAGLHHPLPSVDEKTGGRMHGFLNVLTAAGLAVAHDMSRKEIAEVLRDNSIQHWSFSEDKMGWKNHDILVADIESMRDTFFGIGSCSISEPMSDLAALGLMRGGDR